MRNMLAMTGDYPITHYYHYAIMQTPDPHAALRQRAERRRLVSESLPPDASPEVQRLVQELQVHQIELEMQNEELLLAQAAAEASRLQYVDLYDFAPVGYCTLTPAGTISQLNLRTSHLLGQERQRLRGRRLALFVAPAERDQFAEFVARLWASPGRRPAPTPPAGHGRVPHRAGAAQQRDEARPGPGSIRAGGAGGWPGAFQRGRRRRGLRCRRAGFAGIGLAGIRTRVGLLGGTFSIQSRPGRGTSFFLPVPVPAG